MDVLGELGGSEAVAAGFLAVVFSCPITRLPEDCGRVAMGLQLGGKTDDVPINDLKKGEEAIKMAIGKAGISRTAQIRHPGYLGKEIAVVSVWDLGLRLGALEHDLLGAAEHSI